MIMPPYPLAWPEDRRRCASRMDSRFSTTRAKAMDNVEDSLVRLGADSGVKVTDVQITSNVVGIREKTPTDPGVAVWFMWDGDMRCVAIDRYRKVEENLQAIHHVIEARRTEARHAGIEIVRASFRGFAAALPAPGAKPWNEVLGVAPNASVDQIQAAYKSKARDLGQRGDQIQLSELNVARDKGIKING